MEFRQLGQTDLQVSVICLGTMTFGEQNTEAEGHQQLDYALERGINFIDTAELYSVPPREKTQGSTERIVGSWIKARKNRDRYILATKIVGPGNHVKYIRNPINFSRETILSAIDGSLQRLQTDYVDLYQLHWPVRKTNFFGKLGYRHDPEDPWEDDFLEILETMQMLITAGKVRHFGVSNETAWGLMRFLHLAEKHQLPRCVSIQNPYNLLNRSFEVGLAEAAIREQAGLLAYSPMAFGLLSGKYHQGPKPENTRLSLFPQMSRYNSELSFEATRRYLAIAKNHGLSLAQLSLAFVNCQPFVTSNIIGATTMEQLKENIDSIDISLGPSILQEIEEVHAAISNPAP